MLGPGRTSEAAALSTFFEPLVGDYTWADRKGHITARGTFSAVDSQPTRYCSYNATIWKVSDGKCHGDRDEGDAVQRWVHVDAAATSRSVWRAPRRRFGMAWWPTYPQGYAETFGNQALAQRTGSHPMLTSSPQAAGLTFGFRPSRRRRYKLSNGSS